MPHSKVYLRLTTEKQENLNLLDIKFSNLNKKNDSYEHRDKFSMPRIHLMELSNSEKIDHEEFIKKMKNSLWKK